MVERKPAPEDYQKLGESLTAVLERDVIEMRRHFLWRSFLRGLFIGFGTVLGATIGIGLLLWTLGLLDSVPFVGKLFENARNTIQQGR
ncbi:hypothetical protein HY346_01785 [Candidatus Microgenomates bacterium]|nr:hypothetical protein [Candidatus Microgenomates bacterium]